MRRLATIFISTALFAPPFCVLAQPTGAAPQLAAALRGLRSVTSAYLIGWSADPRPPRNTQDSVSALEAQILALDPADREALLFWLRSHGRDALHQRGATDAQIGPPSYPIDYEIAWTALPEGFVNPTPMPTAVAAAPKNPKPARPRGLFNFLSALPLPKPSVTIASSSHSETHMEGTTMVTTKTSASVSAGVDVAGLAGLLLTAATAPRRAPGLTPHKRWVLLEFGRERLEPNLSGIVVDHGVAGVRNNTEGAACIAFANRNARAAREIDFDMTFVDAHNRFLQTMALRRVGPFAPNAEVDAPRDLKPEQVVHEDANCVTIGHSKTDAPPIPSLARGAALSYDVRRVLFEDGTVWERKGVNAWPTSKGVSTIR